MRVIAKKALVDFYTLYPDAKLSLEDWYRKTIDAQWTCFADIKKSFNSVDAVGNKRFVFNIKGNHFNSGSYTIYTQDSVYSICRYS
jgi:hypothetical protein|nr:MULTISPECIES: type II toxin-antitoxin system HigB family toxin [Capnocytophaga]